LTLIWGKKLSQNSHGFLDNLKSPLQLVEYRAKFYQFAISAILESVGVSTEKLQFVLGSSYQKSPEYVMDVYKLSSLVSEREAKKAGAEIVKQSDNAALSSLLYPVLQVLGTHNGNIVTPYDPSITSDGLFR
jgi:tyrosyl-tRNA synthetase